MTMERTERARATGAVRRALDHHRRVIAPAGWGAQCACGNHYADAEQWKKHQAQEAEQAAETVLCKEAGSP